MCRIRTFAFVRTTDAAVELHAADCRQVVALGIEEQVLEQVLGGILGRRLARTHHAIDFDQRLKARFLRDQFAACWKYKGPGRDR